jgi:hypothetical protein
MRIVYAFSIVLSVCPTGHSFQPHQPHYNLRRSGVGFSLQPIPSVKPSLFSPPQLSQQDECKTRPASLFKSTSFDPERKAHTGKLRRVVEIFKNKSKQCKRVLKRGLLTAIMFFMVFSPLSNPAWAAGRAGARSSRTGGRVSGSFKPSASRTPARSYSSSPPIRSYAPSPTRTYYQPRPRVIFAPPRRHVHVYGNPAGNPLVVGQSFASPVARRGPTVEDALLLTGTGALITYGVMKHYRDRDDDFDPSPLGPGVSMLSLTVALNVPDRFDDNSVLSRLKGLAQRTRSDSRKSVQRLVSDTALELLRQDRSIVSVGSEYKYFKSFNDAEREFNTLSLQKRSKFDRETCECIP